MKRVFYILAVVLLGAMACTRELELVKPAPENSGLVAVTMKLTVPTTISAQTRADNYRDNLPKIDNIRVAVFGTSGYPQAYALAEPVDAVTDVDGKITGYTDGEYAKTNGDTYYFKVLLPVYEGEAHVHVIANGDPAIEFVEQTEHTIMAMMNSTNNVGAYWARVTLEDGILAQLDNNGIMTTDDDGNFIPSDETAALFKDLVLVRNFAEIDLSIAANAGISDVTWTLVNDPVNGSVAPVSSTSKDKDGNLLAFYVDDYKDYIYNPANGKMVLADVDNDGKITNVKKTYDGYMVSPDLNETVPAASAITTLASTPLFCYERIDPNKTKPTYIMLKAKFGEDSDYCYYRVDLMDEEVGGYFPIYRNRQYKIQINTVGNKGASTPEEAAKRNSGGNMSLSAETQTLTDVSDGTGRLYVEYIEKTFTTSGQHSFWVYYVPDITTGTIDNTKISVSVAQQGTALANTTVTLDQTKSVATGEGAMYFYNFTLNGQDNNVDLVSVINVKADNGLTGAAKSTLYRDVTVKVMKKMDMYLSLDPKKVDEKIGEYTVLHIALPDTLQASMFPLEFYIEDANRTLNPTGKDGSGNTISVPVKTGTSLYDASNTHSYYYIRTVNWSEYEPMRDAWIAAKAAEQSTDNIIDFTTQFQTIKATSKTTVYVDCDYFNLGSTNLLNSGIYVFPSTHTVAHDVTSVTVSVDAGESTTEWTVAAGEGVTLDKTGGTGEGSFKMTFGENTSFTEDNTYTATVTSEGNRYTVTVTQKSRVFSISPASQSVAYNATSATVSVTAEDGVAWTASVDNGATLSASSGSGSAVLTVTFEPNDGEGVTTGKTYTVTVIRDGDTSNGLTSVIEQNMPPQSPYTFDASEFSFSSDLGSAESVDGYVTATVGNASSGGSYLQMGRRQNRQNYNGTLTLKSVSGMKITKVEITYYSSTYAGYDTEANGRAVSSGDYDISGDLGTWEGSANNLTFTFGYYGSGNNARFPLISDIKVTYSPE